MRPMPPMRSRSVFLSSEIFPNAARPRTALATSPSIRFGSLVTTARALVQALIHQIDQPAAGRKKPRLRLGLPSALSVKRHRTLIPNLLRKLARCSSSTTAVSVGLGSWGLLGSHSDFAAPCLGLDGSNYTYLIAT